MTSRHDQYADCEFFQDQRTAKPENCTRHFEGDIHNLKRFTTYIFTPGIQHAFFPNYVENYQPFEVHQSEMIFKARYVSYYNAPNASSTHRSIASAPNKKFLTLQVHHHRRKTFFE